MYDPSVIVIVIDIVIDKDNDDAQSNGNGMDRRYCCDYDTVVLKSPTEVPATSKSIDCPKVQQLYPIQLRYTPFVYRVAYHRRYYSSSSVMSSRT